MSEWKNPFTTEPMVPQTRDEWDMEQARREARTAHEWRCFDAWWETVKIELTVGAFKDSNGGRRTPDEVERLYRERRLQTHEVVEQIWEGFPARPKT